MPVKEEQINAYLSSDTNKINYNKKWAENESIVRLLHEITVQVAEAAYQQCQLLWQDLSQKNNTLQ